MDERTSATEARWIAGARWVVFCVLGAAAIWSLAVWFGLLHLPAPTVEARLAGLLRRGGQQGILEWLGPSAGALLALGLTMVAATRVTGTRIGGGAGVRRVGAAWLPVLAMPLTLWLDVPTARVHVGSALLGLAVAVAAWPPRMRDVVANGQGVDAAGGGGWSPGARAAVVGALCLGGFANLAGMGLVRHAAHWSSLIDLGLFYEQYDNASETLLFSPTLGMSFLGEHFSPVLVLLWPILAVWRDPSALIVIQAATLTAGGWLLWRLALDRTGHDALAVALAAAWLWNPQVQQAAAYDFHMDMLEPPMVFGAFLALHRRRDVWVWVCCGLLWCTKEDTFLYTSVLGLWAALFEGRRKLGAVLIAVSLVQAAVVLGWALPALRRPHDPAFFSTTGPQEGYAFLGRYSHLGGSPGAIVATLLGNPFHVLGHLFSEGRLVSWMSLILPFGALALAGRWRLLVIAPVLEMLLANPGAMGEFTYYYGAVVMPFAAVAAVEGARVWVAGDPVQGIAPRARARRAGIGVAIGIAVSLAVLQLGHPSTSASLASGAPSWIHTPRHARIDAALREVPRGVRVVATGYLAVHLQPGRDVRMFPYELDRAEWVVLDLQRPAWPRSLQDVQQSLASLVRSGDWTVVEGSDGFFVLRRNPPAEPVSSSWIDREVYGFSVEAELTEQTAFRGGSLRDAGASNGAFLRVGGRDARGDGYVVFGPYALLAEGDNEVRWVVRWRDDGVRPVAADAEVAVLDVLCGRRSERVRVVLRAADFAPWPAWTEVKRSVGWRRSDGNCEARVFYRDVGALDVDVVQSRPSTSNP